MDTVPLISALLACSLLSCSLASCQGPVKTAEPGRSRRPLTSEDAWDYLRTLDSRQLVNDDGETIDSRGLWIAPILVTYAASGDENRALAERCTRLLGAPDHPLSPRRIQTLLVAIELVPWMPPDAFSAIDLAGKQAIASGAPGLRRIAERFKAVQKWERLVRERVPISDMMSRIESDAPMTRETACVFARWMSACADPMVVAAWIAEMDWGKPFKSALVQPDGSLFLSNSLDVSMEFALAQAHCCRRMSKVPLCAVDGYRKLVAQEGATAIYILLDSLTSCEHVDDDFVAELLLSMINRRCRDIDSLLHSARFLDGFLRVLAPKERVKAAKWLTREARGLEAHLGASDSGYIVSAIQRLERVGR